MGEGNLRRRRWWLLVCAVPLAALPLRACRGSASPTHALGPEVAAALLDVPWTLLRFGTPAAEPFQEEGTDIPLDRRGETWVEARKRVEIRLRIDGVAPRTAVLDLDPYPGTTRVRGLLNGLPVGASALSTGRRRVRFELPADRQQQGANAFTLIFGTPADVPARGDGPRHAARLFGLVVGPPSAALAALATGGAPPFSCWTEKAGVVQAGPSTLRWASDWAGGTLHVSGTLHEWSRKAQARARLRVSVEDAQGTRVLWEREVGAGDHADVRLALPAARGGLQQLSLSVEPVGGAPVWFVWSTLEAAAARARPPARVDAGPLRASLSRANVVLVVFDAAGARHFKSYGHAQATTPEADRLAAEGVLFERAYTPAVFTLSAMSSIWTSLPPDEHHRGVPHDDRLPPTAPTLAERLARAGVRTAGFVANGMAGAGFGLDRGFAEFSYVGYEAAAFRPVLGPWLERAAGGGRFFLYVHVRQPHAPLDAPPPFDTAFGSQRPVGAEEADRWLRAVNDRQHTPTPEEVARLEQLYDGNLAVADRELGWLRRELEKAGLWDDTVLLLTADHGEALHEHGFIGHNAQLYDESLHVPLIVRLPPAAGLAGRRVTEVVDHLDLAPTVADVFGLRGEAVAGFQGRSLLEVALGAPGRGASLARSAGPRPRYALTDAGTRYILDSRYGEDEMYDLAADPGEQHDLLVRDPLRAAVYRQRLHARLLKLPGRWTGQRAAWKLDAKQLEDLRALGYVN
jgi:arylsulfatase A-like enzyme